MLLLSIVVLALHFCNLVKVNFELVLVWKNRGMEQFRPLELHLSTNFFCFKLVALQLTRWGWHYSKNFPCSLGSPKFYLIYLSSRRFIFVTPLLKLLKSNQPSLWVIKCIQALWIILFAVKVQRRNRDLCVTKSPLGSNVYILVPVTVFNKFSNMELTSPKHPLRICHLESLEERMRFS